MKKKPFFKLLLMFIALIYVAPNQVPLIFWVFFHRFLPGINNVFFFFKCSFSFTQISVNLLKDSQGF